MREDQIESKDRPDVKDLKGAPLFGQGCPRVTGGRSMKANVQIGGRFVSLARAFYPMGMEFDLDNPPQIDPMTPYDNYLHVPIEFSPQD